MSVLRTDFSGVFDAGLFTKYDIGGTVTQTGGEIIFDGTDPFVVDVTPVNATDSYFAVQISSYPAANTDYRFFVGAIDSAGRGIGLRFSAGSFDALNRQDSGTAQALTTAGLSGGASWSTSYTFARTRFSGGLAYCEGSSDGVTWTEVFNASVPSGFDITNVRGVFGQAGSFNPSIYKVTNYYAPALAGPAAASDNFNRADGDPGSNWDTMTGASRLQIVSNSVRGDASFTPFALAWKESVANFSDDQESSVTIVSTGTSDAYGPAVRMSIGAGTCYALRCSTGNTDVSVESWNNGSNTLLGLIAGVGVAVSDVFKLRIVGTTLTTFKNGTLVDTRTVTTHSTGQPGIYGYHFGENSTRVDTWSAADASASTSATAAISSGYHNRGLR